MICSKCLTTESKRFFTTKGDEILCYYCYRKRERTFRSEKIILERKKHYQENKEQILKKGKEYAKTNAFGYSYCNSNAKRRGIPFNLTKEQYNEIVSKGCYYCETKDIPRFGARVDRLNNEIGYTYENCVCACSRCNYLKCDLLTAEETKAAILALNKYHKDGVLPEKINFGLYNVKVKRIRALEYKKLITCSKKENIVCELSKTQYENIVSNSCYYCGGHLSQAGYGIDRKDPKGPYSLENCVSCCPTCNKIKWKIYTPNETLVLVNAIQKIRMCYGHKEIETKSRGTRAFTKHHVGIKENTYNTITKILSENGLKLLTSFEEYNTQVSQKKIS